MVPSANMPKRRWWKGDYFTSERGLWGKKIFAKSSSSVHAQLRKDKSKTPQREGGRRRRLCCLHYASPFQTGEG